NVAARRELGALPADKNRRNALAFSPDGKTLATAEPDGSARLWDTRSRRLISRLGGHSGGAWSVAFTPDGKTLAVGSFATGTIKLWDLARREVQATLVGRGVGPSLAFSPDGKKLATAGLDYVVQLWSMVTKEEVAAFRGHQGWIAALAF